MIKIISVEDALKLKSTIFIDVRSPKEFNEATIPKSLNIPILYDDEREIVGKAYKKKNIQEATSLGLGFASHKLEGFYNDIINLRHNYENIVVFCWRGGMRSRSICNILNLLNIKNVYQLIGGYKSYRKLVYNFLENDISKYHFVVLHGLTGVGKTNILKKLQNRDVTILDLENLAQNAGSVFGNMLYSNNSPSQKNFESEVFITLYSNKNKYVVVESESKRIGRINVPNTIINQMEKGTHILINTSLENRISNIYDDYISQQDLQDTTLLNNEIIKSLLHLKKRLGNDAIDSLISMINDNKYKEVIKYLIENYYDPLYNFSINKTKNYDLEVNYDKIDCSINKICDYLTNMFE